MARKDAIPKSKSPWLDVLPSDMESGPFCNRCEYLAHEGACDKRARPCPACSHPYNAPRNVLHACSCACHDGPRFIFGVALASA